MSAPTFRPQQFPDYLELPEPHADFEPPCKTRENVRPEIKFHRKVTVNHVHVQQVNIAACLPPSLVCVEEAEPKVIQPVR